MADVLNRHPARSTVELVQQASEQIGRLVRAEIALARAELAGQARRAALGAALLAAAGVLGFFGLAALVATAVIALASVLPLWAAAAAVTTGLLVVAAVLALVARARLAGVRTVGPAAALDSVRADLEEFRHALTDRGKDVTGTGTVIAGPVPAGPRRRTVTPGRGAADTVRDAA